ncbi:MAG: PH domain-containing protein [Clostridia bacterium]|nr:PH domain-containing protein [Clostridia bacterium]
MENKEYIWKARKRTIFGLPLSFTVYKLTEEKLFIETGFLSKKEEEIRLYRILDLTLHRPLGQRIFGVGTIHCCTADKSTPEFEIIKIKNAKKVKELLSECVEEERMKKRIRGRETFSDEIHDDEHDNDGDIEEN